MIPGHQKRRGNPDAYGAIPSAAPHPPIALPRYRLLLTRLPGRWELIIFDRQRTGVMRRLEGQVVDALRETEVLPEALHAEGACDADKSLVKHLFLAAAALDGAMEQRGRRWASPATRPSAPAPLATG